MDLIIRTAHGTADVAVDIHDPATPLRTLLAWVSGQAAPHAALVDGRPVDAEQPIHRCGVIDGSVIDTDLGPPTDPVLTGPTLLQLTGPGAGATRALPEGRFRIGPGRRAQAGELAAAPVGESALELTVSASGTTTLTAATAGAGYGGRMLTPGIVWGDGVVTVGGRAFALEHSVAGRSIEPRRADASGRLPYNRPPGAAVTRRLGVIDARRDAEQLRPGLWRRRLGPGAPCPIQVGHATADPGGTRPGSQGSAGSEGSPGLDPVDLDLASDPVVAVVGGRAATTGHARALLIDAATAYGPADLDIVVAADRARLGDWDWIKWLPHARANGSIRLFADDDDLAAFVSERTPSATRRTLLIIDSDEHARGAGSPLRQLVVDVPPDVSMVVLTEHAAEAPEQSSVVIDHGDPAHPGLVDLVRPAQHGVRRILAPLPDLQTASDVARHLAGLIDPDLPPERHSRDAQIRSLAELIGLTGRRPAPTVRWGTRVGIASPATMPVGAGPGGMTTIDIGLDRSVIVSGNPVDHAIDVVRTLVASMATAWSPDELAIVGIDHRRNRSIDPIASLPHDAGTFSGRGAHSVQRLIERLEAASNDSTGNARHVATVVYGLADTELAAPGLVHELARLATTMPQFHLIVATERPPASIGRAVRDACSIEITIEDSGGRRRASIHDRTRYIRTTFTPFVPIDPDAPLTVQPMVVGRPPTALERRLERLGAHLDEGAAFDRDVECVVALLNDHVGTRNTERRLVPAPLPTVVDAHQMFAQHRGHDVPLGLCEVTGQTDPVAYVWRPKPDASMLVIGSPRSGTRAVLDTLLLGACERFTQDELRVFVIDQNDARRGAVADIGIVDGVSAPGDEPGVTAMLEQLGARRRPTDSVPTPGAPPVLLIVRDVERLTPSARSKLLDLAATGSPSGVHVVATATRPTAQLLDAFAHVLVGDLGERSDAAGHGGTDDWELDRSPGRCIVLGDQRLVQLANLSGPIEAILTTMSPTELRSG